MNALGRAATLWALGPTNVARVALYRLGLRSGLHPVLRIRADVPARPFFSEVRRSLPEGAVPRRDWRDTAVYFGRHEFPIDGPPDWHANPFAPGTRAEASLDWSAIPDFDPAVGDIKTVWEASRFDWLVAMAQRVAAGDQSELDRLDDWIADWAAANPPYRGANWKCGQEASIRVMNLALASIVLGTVEAPAPGLPALVRLHLQRIAPTMGYAIGQQNNHGTSEAAALFIGGSWLESLGQPDAAGWHATGRRWLEERARSLIEKDGTFSQYSVVYHRVMLDTYGLAECWRAGLRLPDFSGDLRRSLASATRWLARVTNPATGDAPNLGANDGARLMGLADVGFRDFRPSVQLAAALFCNERAISGDGPWNQPLRWLGIAHEDLPPTPALQSASHDDGGFHVLRRERAVAILRYPRFRFRPSQSDLLHLDVWVDGENLLRDAGTYSYNAHDVDGGLFSGAAGHNTISFDGRDQMPRLGRFLYGAWPKALDVTFEAETGGKVIASAGYRDRWGASHHRRVALEDTKLTCTDVISGFREQAVLRWRLSPGDWTLSANGVSRRDVALTVAADRPPRRVELVTGLESRHYLEKSPLPVLEIEVEPGTSRLTTTLVFGPRATTSGPA